MSKYDTSKKWIKRFFEIARKISSWSSDTTKVGAVAVDDQGRIIQTGFNDFPPGVLDKDYRRERPTKYMFMSHAEENIVAYAARKVLQGSTIFLNLHPCSSCARQIITAGVKKIIINPVITTKMPIEEFNAASEMFQEAGVTVIYMNEDGEEIDPPNFTEE